MADQNEEVKENNIDKEQDSKETLTEENIKQEELAKSIKDDIINRKNKKHMAEEEETQKDKGVFFTSEEFDGIKRQMAKALNDYKELRRDFNNYIHRTDEEVAGAKVDGIKEALGAVLPALDSLKKVRKVIKDKGTLHGISLVERNVLSALKKLGVTPIKCVGEKFDPAFHEAVLAVKDESKESGTIVEEVAMGYKMGNTVLKYSQVVVVK